MISADVVKKRKAAMERVAKALCKRPHTVDQVWEIMKKAKVQCENKITAYNLLKDMKKEGYKVRRGPAGERVKTRGPLPRTYVIGGGK